MIIVDGGIPLRGNVRISGAKNSVLPILAATLLTEQPVGLSRVPHLKDVKTVLLLLKTLGADCLATGRESFLINTQSVHTTTASMALVSKMRASILLLGPLLARFGQAVLPLPGGCAIGGRPVDFHLSALQAMGASVQLADAHIQAQAPKAGLHGAEIYFPMPTVTGTENIMMAAVLARGHTTLHNAAKEPEVVDLARFLKALGAKITGEGTDCIHIEGVPALGGVSDYAIMFDRIEAGTFLVAAALTRGDVTLHGVDASVLTQVLQALKQAGVQYACTANTIHVQATNSVLKAVDIQTKPYPGFPTDMQAQWMVLNAVAQGRSMIQETLFENRFMHVPSLQAMGAEIQISDHDQMALIQGGAKLQGTTVVATDLRASAGLVLAGLAAQGRTVIQDIYHLDRGYDSMEKKLIQLGARIQRVASGAHAPCPTLETV